MSIQEDSTDNVELQNLAKYPSAEDEIKYQPYDHERHHTLICKLHKECLGFHYSVSVYADLKNKGRLSIVVSKIVKKSGEEVEELVGTIAARTQLEHLSQDCMATEAKNVFYIPFLAVRKEDRRKGYGFKLLDSLIQTINRYVKEHNTCIDGITLHVRVDNEPAQKLYKTLGFQIVRTMKNYYTEPDGTRSDAFLMARVNGNGGFTLSRSFWSRFLSSFTRLSCGEPSNEEDEDSVLSVCMSLDKS
jgi:ribosomal protein S18 acetylase RimI-like enzyme